jgi:hypothetical protein
MRGMFMSTASFRHTFLRDMPLPDDRGRPLTDDSVSESMRYAVAAFERKYAVRTSPRLIKLGRQPVPDEPEATVDTPLEIRDALPFDPRAWEDSRHVSLHLPIGPVKEVYAVALRLPGQLSPVVFPPSWIQPDYRAKIVQLYPGASLTPMPIATTAFGMAAMSSGRTIPNAWQIVYLAGYTADDLIGQDSDVEHALGMLTAVSLLVPGSIDRFMSRGVAGLSASVDGLSNSTQLMQSPNGVKYGALIAAYRDSLTDWEKTYEHRRTGPIMGSA